MYFNSRRAQEEDIYFHILHYYDAWANSLLYIRVVKLRDDQIINLHLLH